MKKVCVDTNMLVWYVKRSFTKGQEDFLEKADYLFEYFEKNNIQVVIPSIAVAELLGSVEDEEERGEYFDFMSNNFEIIQHDILSAKVYAELRVKLSKSNAKSYASSQNIPKCMMTNDYNICSMAISSGCDAIFSHNLKHFEKFADHKIPIYDLNYVEDLKVIQTEYVGYRKEYGDPSQTSLIDQLNEKDK